jgi:hypothetical protein
MAYTRTQARTRVQDFLDAVGSSRWSSTEIDQAMSHVFDTEWRGILDANPFYKAEQISATASAAGVIAKSVLSTGSGNTAHRLNKIISAVAAGVPLSFVRFSDYSNALQSGAAPMVYWELGDNLQISPAGAISVTFTINYLPTSPASLAADGDSVIFPDGFEDILFLGTAAYLLGSKNGAEAEAAVPLVGLARDRRGDLYRAVARPTTGGMQLRYEDSASIWGA